MMSKRALEQGGLCRSDLHTKVDRREMQGVVGFIDLEKVYDRVDREALWQVLRTYDVGGKFLSGIKSMYIDSSACVRVKVSGLG